MLNFAFSGKGSVNNNILTCFSYFSETEDIKDVKGVKEQKTGIKKPDVKLKPGQQKFTQNPLEALRLKKQLLRMQKSRIVAQLKKMTVKLKDQFLEPVESLFILYEKQHNKYKYFWCGEIVERFEKGADLVPPGTKCSKIGYVDKESFPKLVFDEMPNI